MTEPLLHLLFAFGGGFGAVARYLLTTVVTHRFPLSTLIVNVAGCFILGLGLSTLWDASALAGEEQRRLLVGFCGGFTTFSSFAYQSFDLHRTDTLLHAAVNVIASVLLCVMAFVAGRGAGALLVA
ncbi:MAG: CrcB family protein [Gammaproteobacteria bacterium]